MGKQSQQAPKPPVESTAPEVIQTEAGAQPSEAGAVAQTSAPTPTGTERIGADKGRAVIPGPILSKWEKAPSPEEAALAKKDKEDAKAAERAGRQAPFVTITSAHLIKTFAGNFDSNRRRRLMQLSRRNRDVAWLLAEFDKLSTQPNQPQTTPQ